MKPLTAQKECVFSMRTKDTMNFRIGQHILIKTDYDESEAYRAWKYDEFAFADSHIGRSG